MAGIKAPFFGHSLFCRSWSLANTYLLYWRRFHVHVSFAHLPLGSREPICDAHYRAGRTGAGSPRMHRQHRYATLGIVRGSALVRVPRWISWAWDPSISPPAMFVVDAVGLTRGSLHPSQHELRLLLLLVYTTRVHYSSSAHPVQANLQQWVASSKRVLLSCFHLNTMVACQPEVRNGSKWGCGRANMACTQNKWPGMGGHERGPYRRIRLLWRGLARNLEGYRWGP